LNVFRFDSADEYSAILRCERPLEISHEYGGKYCILIDHYKHKLKKKNQWLWGFKGERCVVIDGGDKENYWSPFIDFCTKSPHIYVKDNSYRPTKNPNVRIGCYRPSDKSVALIKKHNIRPGKGGVEVYFRGDLHYGRECKVREMKRHCKTEGYTYDLGASKYSRLENLKRMAKAGTVICYNGKGTRTRRHWEALLVGAEIGVEKNVLDQWPILMSNPPYETIRRCFLDCTVPIYLRMAALYSLYGEPQLWTYEDVEKAEEAHGLS
jgi:hypothetical protein